MVNKVFDAEEDLHAWLEQLQAGYGRFATLLWEADFRSSNEIANYSLDELQGLGLTRPAALNIQCSTAPGVGSEPATYRRNFQALEAQQQLLQQDVQYIMELQKQSKLSKTAYGPSCLLPLSDVREDLLWKNHVLDQQLASIAQPDQVLPKARPLAAELRYLQLLLDNTPEHCEAVQGIVRQRLKRRIGDKDYELPYLPVVRAILQFAAMGQEGIEFLPEKRARADKAREDICGMVGGSTRAVPVEIKPYVAIEDQDVGGLYANKLGLGKVYKATADHSLPKQAQQDETRYSTGLFVTRCQYVWLLFFQWQWDRNCWQLKDCRVTPDFPAGRNVKAENYLTASLADLQQLNDDMSQPQLRDLMLLANNNDTSPPLGFRYLVRWVDHIADIHKLRMAPIFLEPKQPSCTNIQPLPSVRLLGTGQRSVVILLQPSDDYVIKIGATESIEHEVAMHQVVDSHGCPYIRRQQPGSFGTVHGAGSGLSYVALLTVAKGSLSQFAVISAPESLTVLCKQACEAVMAIHTQGVLHCDLKPSNILLTDNDELLVNDYDLACYTSAPHKGVVGTPRYSSPRLQAERAYTEGDDWLSLGLAFADLLRLDRNSKHSANKWDILRSLAKHKLISGTALAQEIDKLLPPQ